MGVEKPVSNGKRTITSFLVYADPAIKNSLSYLFSVVLKFEFDGCVSADDVARRLHRGAAPHLVFVDMTHDVPQALESIRQLRSYAADSVIIAMQRPDSRSGCDAFVAGASDVVVWPCNLRELAARLMVRLSQTPGTDLLPDETTDWDAEAYITSRASLTVSEAQVMRVLYAHDGKIVSRDEMSLAVDARPWRYGDRKFDVHVAKLRKKLSKTFGDGILVSTVRSSGYRLCTGGANIFELS